MKKKVFVCPKSGGTNWKVPQISYSGLVEGARYNPLSKKCDDCGYAGVFLEVDADKLKKVQGKIKKSKY